LFHDGSSGSLFFWNVDRGDAPLGIGALTHQESANIRTTYDNITSNLRQAPLADEKQICFRKRRGDILHPQENNRSNPSCEWAAFMIK
jgi:hypothetical protein